MHGGYCCAVPIKAAIIINIHSSDVVKQTNY